MPIKELKRHFLLICILYSLVKIFNLQIDICLLLILGTIFLALILYSKLRLSSFCKFLVILIQDSISYCIYIFTNYNIKQAHIAGVGDYHLSGITALADPCPLPTAAKKKGLRDKEKLFYAPMSGLGDLLYDKDAVYININDHFVQFSKDDGANAEGIQKGHTLICLTNLLLTLEWLKILNHYISSFVLFYIYMLCPKLVVPILFL